MHACMYVCIQVCMYVCMNVYMYLCMYVCIHVRMYVCIYALLSQTTARPMTVTRSDFFFFSMTVFTGKKADLWYTQAKP